mgnify:CR=1 FL=1
MAGEYHSLKKQHYLVLMHISESEPHLHGLLALLSRAKAPTHVMETNG